jgi:pimeloyl-ACP methyl ester carboxylesterase
MFLHGFLSSRNAWTPLRRELAEMETVAPDMLGYGRAGHSGADYTLEETVAHLQQVAETERPTHVVGHSMGGIVALALARQQPGAFASVGVIGLPVFYDRQDGTQSLRSRGIVYRGFLRADRVAHIGCVGMQRTAPLWLPFAPLLLPRQPRSVLRTTFDHCRGSHQGSLDGIVFAGVVAEIAAGVDTPVFGLHGARDRTAPLDRARRLADERGWDFRVAANVGHQLPVEQPRLAARWIRECLLGRPECVSPQSREGPGG